MRGRARAVLPLPGGSAPHTCSPHVLLARVHPQPPHLLGCSTVAVVDAYTSGLAQAICSNPQAAAEVIAIATASSGGGGSAVSTGTGEGGGGGGRLSCALLSQDGGAAGPA